MKDQIFSGKDSMLIIAFLRYFRLACDTYNFQEVAAMWHYEHYLSGSVEAVIMAWVALPAEASK